MFPVIDFYNSLNTLLGAKQNRKVNIKPQNVLFWLSLCNTKL